MGQPLWKARGRGRGKSRKTAHFMIEYTALKQAMELTRVKRVEGELWSNRRDRVCPADYSE